jgi:5-(carboxyamino)imidazole ribonucleotide mutase
MTAAITPLPVIGVPVKTRALSGVDSLYSIVQMPGGIPVATVAINGAKNAGLLAVQILAAFDEELADKVNAYKADLDKSVLDKAEKLEQVGYSEYLNSL